MRLALLLVPPTRVLISESLANISKQLVSLSGFSKEGKLLS